MSLRILVTGSRRWPATSTAVVERAIEEALLLSTVRPPVLVHGGCPDPRDFPDHLSVDMIADRYWRSLIEQGWHLAAPEVHEAEWSTLGHQAGPARNSAMVKLGATICLGFPLPDSRGTRDCLRKARGAGIWTQEYRP